MKKLIAVAVLAAFSSLPYAAEKDITTDVVVVGQGAAGTAAAFAAAEQGAKVIGIEKKGMVGEQVISPKVFSLSAPRCSATTTFL